MARVTIEGLLSQCESRFELSMLISYRAHALANGEHASVNNSNKFAVLALREMEAGKINIEELKKIVVERYAIETKNNAINSLFLKSDNLLVEDKTNNEAEKSSSKEKDDANSSYMSKDFFSADN